MRLTREEWYYLGAAAASTAGVVATVAALRLRGGGEGTEACPLSVFREFLADDRSPEMADRAWRFFPIVRHSSVQFGVPVSLLAALIHTESRWSPDAKSRAGAVGLTQQMPKTAVNRFARLVEEGRWPFGALEVNNDPQRDGLLRERGVERFLDRTDPAQSAWLGAAMLRSLLSMNIGVELALAYYNGGHKVLDLPKSEWPAETRSYVPGVLRRQRKYERLLEACGDS